MSEIKCNAQFRVDSGSNLTANRDFTQWITNLPADAVLSPITEERGSQRDPWTVLVGLRANWTEIR